MRVGKLSFTIALFVILFSVDVFALPSYSCRITPSTNYIVLDTKAQRAISLDKVSRSLALAKQKIKAKISKLKKKIKGLKSSSGTRNRIQQISRQVAILRQDLRKVSQQAVGVRRCKSASPFKLPPNIGSIIEVETFELPAERSLSVSGDLTILASGDVIINGGIKARGSNGQVVKIDSRASVRIAGSLVAGKGASNSRQVIKGFSITSGAGQPGGDVIIKSPQIFVEASAVIAGGDGGFGEDLKVVAGPTRQGAVILNAKTRFRTSSADSPELTLRAGDGGKGGDVVLDAGEGILTIIPNSNGQPVIILGNGGRGGNSTAEASEDSDISQLNALGGKGGDSGFPRFAASRIDGLNGASHVISGDIFGLVDEGILRPGGTLTILDTLSSLVFAGGEAGDAGDSINGEDDTNSALTVGARKILYLESTAATVLTTVSAANSCSPSAGARGRDCTPPKGKQGGHGFFTAGVGGTVRCKDAARHGRGTGDGGIAETEGGDGGNLRIIFGVSTSIATSPNSDFGLGFVVGAVPLLGGGQGRGAGGIGGNATSIAGDGGKTGGSGGNSKALGGRGGNAPRGAPGPDFSLLPTIAGPGGTSLARGGEGQDGVSCCPSEAGQNGGSGGGAIAEGGPGGEAVIPNYGGSATAASGKGGVGGDGEGPGLGGVSGQAQAAVGNLGDGTLSPPSAQSLIPSARQELGSSGADGKMCAGPTPTPTATPNVSTTCPSGQYFGNSSCAIGQLFISGPGPLGSGSTISFPTGPPGSLQCQGTTDCVCSYPDGESVRCCITCLPGPQPMLSVSCTDGISAPCVEPFFGT